MGIHYTLIRVKYWYK